MLRRASFWRGSGSHGHRSGCSFITLYSYLLIVPSFLVHSSLLGKCLGKLGQLLQYFYERRVHSWHNYYTEGKPTISIQSFPILLLLLTRNIELQWFLLPAGHHQCLCLSTMTCHRMRPRCPIKSGMAKYSTWPLAAPPLLPMTVRVLRREQKNGRELRYHWRTVVGSSNPLLLLLPVEDPRRCCHTNAETRKVFGRLIIISSLYDVVI